jgi:tRNA threonylcarbamoyladenosine biosynthesis protein TsaB
MKILAFDTCMQACSAALLDTNETGQASTCVSRYEDMSRGHAERLLPMIEEVLQEAETDIGQVDLFAATRGPGTFTGVRIGIATARGFALACDKPLTGFNSLQVMHARLLSKAPQMTADRLVAIAADARRGEVYWQLFDRGGQPAGDPSAMPPVQAARRAASLETPMLIAGSGAKLVLDQLPEGANDIDCGPLDLLPDAASLAKLAVTTQISDDQDRRTISPLYLRAPDAKIPQGHQIERC